MDEPDVVNHSWGETNEVRQVDALLTPAEVAAMFSVHSKTVSRWAKQGKLTPIRTLGGHRRFRASEVKRLLEAQSPPEGP